MAVPPKAFLSPLPSHLLLCHTSSIFSYISVTQSATPPDNALTLPWWKRRCGLILIPQIPGANTNMAESFVHARTILRAWGGFGGCEDAATAVIRCLDECAASCVADQSSPCCSLPRSLRGTMDQRAVAPAGPASAEPPACTGRASQGRWSPCCRTHTRSPTLAAGNSP